MPDAVLDTKLDRAPDSSLRDSRGRLLLGGGLPIAAEGDEVFGTIGVVGALDGTLDQAFAMAGIDMVGNRLTYGLHSPLTPGASRRPGRG